MKPKKMYYLNGTHWDREWYKPFQGFRYLLMNVLDEVIETLENDPAFELYVLDGQTAVLDDYLEISPQMRPRLEKLIREQRIAVGPWYTMPDEFIPSGESLIRNLLLGHQKALEYGAPSAMRLFISLRHFRPYCPDAPDSGRLRHPRRSDPAGL